MRGFISALFALLFMVSCNTSTPQQVSALDLSNYNQFGDKSLVTKELPHSKDDALKLYQSLKEGDAESYRFQTTINEVCAEKGCWMKLDLGQGEEAFIKFKDYAFFVPKDAAGKNVVVNGTAELKVTSVEELQHYAEDAGKSKEEIAAITEPKVTYYFLATDVLIAK